MTELHGFTEEAGHVVDRVEQFDYDSLDSIDDRIREALKNGESVVVLVGQLIDYETSERVAQAISSVICYIADAEKPRLAADHVAWISGMRIRQGQSLPQLAKKHGVSKQAFCQAALRLAKLMGIKQTRAMRSESAKAMMKIRHYKKTKLK